MLQILFAWERIHKTSACLMLWGVKLLFEKKLLLPMHTCELKETCWNISNALFSFKWSRSINRQDFFCTNGCLNVIILTEVKEAGLIFVQEHLPAASTALKSKQKEIFLFFGIPHHLDMKHYLYSSRWYLNFIIYEQHTYIYAYISLTYMSSIQ